MSAALAQLETLLRARKLDATIRPPGAPPPALDGRLAPAGWAPLDARLGGGLPRGHLSEIVGPPSSGRTGLLCRLAAAAIGRGEVVALVDTSDRFDPVSAAAAGVDLARLLWIRAAGEAERAVKAMHLVLQAGGFGLVALDLADVRPPAIRRFPHTTWPRLARAVEGGDTVALLVGAERIARSAGGVTLALEGAAPHAAGEWSGTTPRARRLRGLAVRPRVIAARGLRRESGVPAAGSW